MSSELYFVYPMLEELRSCTNEARIMELKERIAVNIGDPDTLNALLGDNDFRNFYPDLEPRHVSTDDTIDSFIEKFGRPGENSADAPLLPETAAPSDYFASLETETEPEAAPAVETKPEAAPQKVVETEPARKVAPPSAPAKPTPKPAPKPAAKKKSAASAPASSLSLELAKIMVKNGNYPKALEIINEFYLNNPEKSIYFADQIRFIKKMMLNEQRKNIKK